MYSANLSIMKSWHFTRITHDAYVATFARGQIAKRPHCYIRENRPASNSRIYFCVCRRCRRGGATGRRAMGTSATAGRECSGNNLTCRYTRRAHCIKIIFCFRCNGISRTWRAYFATRSLPAEVHAASHCQKLLTRPLSISLDSSANDDSSL